MSNVSAATSTAGSLQAAGCLRTSFGQGPALAGLIRSSTVDFPGNLSAVLFTPGCNLDCFYCHNRPLISGATERLAHDDVLAFLRKRSRLLDGVVITGGEPLLQSGLPNFLKQIRQLGYAIKLDTNGTQPAILADLLAQNILDYVAIDYKAPWEKYPAVTGSDAKIVQAIKQSFSLLMQSTASLRCGWEARTTVCPSLSIDDLTLMATSLPVLPRFVLQRYQKPAVYRPQDKQRIDDNVLSPAEIRQAATYLKKFQPNTETRC